MQQLRHMVFPLVWACNCRNRKTAVTPAEQQLQPSTMGYLHRGYAWALDADEY